MHRHPPASVTAPCAPRAPRRSGALTLLPLVAALACALPTPEAAAQGIADAALFERVQRVEVMLANPSGDAERDARTIDRVRTAIGVFPGERYSREALDFSAARTRRVPGVANVAIETQPGETGDAVVVVMVTQRGEGEGAAPPTPEFPVLVDRNGTYLRAKVDGFLLYYGNGNAWYGRPDQMLAGNPLVVGSPSGKGYEDWIEAYAHVGLYGITPINDAVSVYGGVSTMATVSFGQELFTDKSRSYAAVEDAYIGVVGGRTDDAGNRFTVNASAGRQRYTLGDGMLIVNTAMNGDNRAALQANARWSADFVGQVQVRYNDTRVDVFRVDPDEIPKLDSRTVIDGINIESELRPGLTVGAAYLRVPRSSAGYFLPDGTRLERDGLRVYDLRARWHPRTAGAPGWFFATEIAKQEHSDFAMRATAYQGEVGYAFTDVRWAPTVSYRYSHFSGDDPDTDRYERWDPLLSGGTGEQWVQGANHFKVVQDSNVIAHRLQLRIRPHAKLELVPQAWLFRADSRLNLGGNPALSFLQSDDYGSELNLTAKVFWSRNLYLHGHVAVTFPGDAVKRALGGTQRDWWSTMVFARYAF